MATIVRNTCLDCDTVFTRTVGPTMTADNLTCDRCGRSQLVSHAAIGDVHLRYIKGLAGPWSVSRTEADAFVRAHYPGEPLERADYEVAAEDALEPCSCGGRFRYGAPARCPRCGATEDRWDQAARRVVARAC